MEIEQIAPNLEMREPGLWFSKKTSSVSYPEEGSSLCFQLEEHSFWFEHRNACIVELIRSFPPAGPIFDIGGGNGFVSLAIQNAGFQSILVEPSRAGVRNAKDRGVSTVICSTIGDCGFEPGAMSAVGLFDVLEHLEEDESFLNEIGGLLSWGGKIYLTTPAYNLMWSQEDDYAGHQRRYTLSSLEKKLVGAGFKIDYATYFFAFLPIPILLYRTIPSQLGLRKEVTLERERREHSPAKGFVGKMIDTALRMERKALARRRRIPFGASCLLVASAVK